MAHPARRVRSRIRRPSSFSEAAAYQSVAGLVNLRNKIAERHGLPLLAARPDSRVCHNVNFDVVPPNSVAQQGDLKEGPSTLVPAPVVNTLGRASSAI